MIKAVYGYEVIINKEWEEDEHGNIDVFIYDEDILKHHPGLRLDYTPLVIKQLSSHATTSVTLIKMFKTKGDGVRVGYRTPLCEMLENVWTRYETPSTSFSYNIPEYEPYMDRRGYYHYNFVHRYHCCSKSAGTTVILGLTYDEIERDLFHDTCFNDMCKKVFNFPTSIKTLDATLLQHDLKDLPVQERRSDDDRKQDLLAPFSSLATLVNSMADKFENKPKCYLMLDDCTFCTFCT